MEDAQITNKKGRLVNKKRHEAAIKAKDKRIEENPNYYREIASRGGLASTHRPMKDPEYARKLVNIRWAKYRAAKENE